MIFFNNKNTVARFTGTSRDYITREAVVRANERLMHSNDAHKAGLKSIYDELQIARPTREKIATAASNAMRQLAPQNN